MIWSLVIEWCGGWVWTGTPCYIYIYSAQERLEKDRQGQNIHDPDWKVEQVPPYSASLLMGLSLHLF
jgi:hypothetical protein